MLWVSSLYLLPRFGPMFPNNTDEHRPFSLMGGLALLLGILKKDILSFSFRTSRKMSQMKNFFWVTTENFFHDQLQFYQAFQRAFPSELRDNHLTFLK